MTAGLVFLLGLVFTVVVALWLADGDDGYG